MSVEIENTPEELKETLHLSDYMAMCYEFEKDPTEQNFVSIQNFISKLQIRSYMPLKEKMMCLVCIGSHIENSVDAAATTASLECLKLKYGILGYCTNLDSELGLFLHTFSAYDACYEHGLAEAVENVCKKDYMRFERMLSDMLNFSNIERLTESMALFDDTEFDKWVDIMNGIETKLTPELVDTMSYIAEYNKDNSGIADIVNIVNDEAARYAQLDLEGRQSARQHTLDIIESRKKEKDNGDL